MTKTTSSLGGTSDEPSAAVGMAELGRAAVTAAVLGRHGGRVAIGALRGQGATPLAAAEAKTAFAELGPTYVKLAQMIASSPGLFPEVLANEFRSLLDEVPPVGEEDLRRVVLRELGDQPENLFESFDLQPLASASIAQVHAATLPGGEDVVVKIQRPGIRAGVQQDLRILMLVARLLERTSASGRMANPIGIVEDFEVTLGEELNFVHEARGMELFEHNLRAYGDNDTVRVPAVHWRYTTPRVLTMERIHGYKIDDLAQLGAKGWDLAGALKRAVRAWLEGALQHGFFHGDAHAGNLMIDTEGRVVFLDFGITGHLDDKTRDVIRTGLPALLVSRDFRTVATSIYELGAVLSPLDLDQASKDIAALVEPILEKPLSEISYGQVLVDIVKVGTGYGVRLPRELVLVAKQLLYFERYAKLMAPDWSILNDPELIGFLFESVVEPTVV
ncbi:phosphotransferase [Acidiferrimicrobium sp. IK]|uniref:ABC1 kinase family protein n=1 Tax=Acidiferrimicrobium sp. IK TaxID=2871700 RepID=UPI0021CB3950|nr:AarF/UbiB family protein [Acidiferrimicrobium sp. IK]MCU4187412.1 phosphotransferase [Acidiferrimicrobium sp. IK]